MSLPQKSARKSEQTSSLLLEEPYTPVQLGLRHLFGRNEAELIQNVNYWLNAPWEDWSLKLNMRVVFDDERFWVRIPPRMLSDRFTGRARDLSESTLKRAFSSSITQGVMLVRTDLSDDDEKNVRWVTLVREVLDPQLLIYQTIWKQLIEERLMSRSTTGKLLSDGREDELWNAVQLRLLQCRETLRAQGLFDLQKTYEPAGVQNDTAIYKVSSAAIRRSKMTLQGVQNDTAPSSKRAGVGANLDPKTALPPYRKEKTKRKTIKDTPAALPQAEPQALSSAVTDVVVENLDSLSGVASDDKTTTDLQLKLMGLLTTLTPHPTEATARLVRRFQAMTRTAYDIECPDEIAARVVARVPIAILDDAAVKCLIGPDRESLGLDLVIGGVDGKALLSNIDDLRWQIFIWPGLKPEIEDYYARTKKQPKLSGSFVTKFREKTPPPRAWVSSLIADANYALRGETQALQQTKADATWAALDDGQRRAFDEELFQRVERMPGSVDANRARLKLQMLGDADFLESLTRIELNPILEAQKMAAEMAAPQGVGEDSALTSQERNRCDLYISRLRFKIEDGEIEREDLPREISNLGCSDTIAKNIEAALRGVKKLGKAA